MKYPTLRTCGLLVIGAALQSIAASDQPNILFIAVDDLKPTLSAYGSPVPTPQIDRIAERGTTFLNAHCQQAVCGPSRASLLTGKRPDYTRVWDLKTRIRDIRPEIITLPQHFKENGYHTVGVGKIFDPRSVDKGADEISWSERYTQTWHLKYHPSTGKPKAHYHNPLSKKLAKQAEAGGIKSWGAINKLLADNDAWPVVEAEDLPDDAYDDGAIAAYAVAKLKKLADLEKPFFFAVGFKKPHLPFIAPKKYWDKFDRSTIKLARFQKQALNSPDYAYHDFNELRSYSGIPGSGPLSEGLQRELIHGYYACTAYIDAQVGRLLDQLKKLKLANNTVVVLWGDHGWHLGDHGLWCKHTNYEHATRVPLIISAPGGRRGLQTGMPTELTDLFPTLCELAEIEIPADLDGVSLTPTLLEGDETTREFAVSQFPRGPQMGYALRSGRFRYVAWYKTGGTSTDGESAPIATELFDYKLDPQETRNLSGTKQFSLVEESLSAKLEDFLKRQHL